jgi:CO dehydrogenase/acetyl-CoA synthase gamma subunit (corrinoid Fe-S protein)
MKAKAPIGNSLTTDVQALKIMANRMANDSIQDACRTYKQMKDYKEAVEADLKLLAAAIDKAKQETLPTMFKENGIGSIAVDGYRYVISENVRASIPPDTKEQAYQWLREHELEKLIIETVNASTLAAEARRMIEAGKELDPDLFNVYILPNTSVTKVS